MLSVIIIVSWEWLPFASLILLTALQSLDEEQKEAASLDGAGPISYFGYIVLPHICARDHRRHPDRDDFPVERVRGNLRHDHRRPRQRDDQHSLPRLQAGAAELRHRRRVGRRHHRRHSRQHRCVLPDAHHRQKSGGLNDGVEAINRQAHRRHGRRLGRRVSDLLPDPVDVHDQLQDASSTRSRCRRNSCSSTGRSRTISRFSSGRTI